MLTFDQAEEILKDAFPGEYVSLCFERTTRSCGDSKTEIRMYTGSYWTAGHPTFELALRDIVESATSPSEGIHD